MGPVRYDAAGTTGQKIWWLGLSNIADASVLRCGTLIFILD